MEREDRALRALERDVADREARVAARERLLGEREARVSESRGHEVQGGGRSAACKDDERSRPR
jgi:hypothetical protein